MDQILYHYHENLYVNITNRCPCSCVFCERQYFQGIGDAPSLWLEKEPSAEEIFRALEKENLEQYRELVFCGYGEPAERLWDVLEIAGAVKEYSRIPVRLNTNGLADCIWGKSCAPYLKGRIDLVSVSLNTPDKERYLELTRSKFGIQSFDAVLKFASDCVKLKIPVRLTTVSGTLSGEEEENCRKIAEAVGAEYKIRPYEEPGSGRR